MKKQQIYIPAILLLSFYAIWDNGESILGLTAAFAAVVVAFIYFGGILADESQEPTSSDMDSRAWGDISDSEKWDFKD